MRPKIFTFEPMNNFLNELKWRGMLADSMPGTEEWLSKGPTAGYVGFDPTADSLHVGHLVQIMLLVHLQRAGHTPIALIGGATGMVGDPSGKSQERNLLSANDIAHNTAAIRKQMESFLDFSSAKLLNNLDWFGSMGFIDFIRDVGKHIPVTYMMAKESVKKRLETGMSFTEFTYQLLQGYDYYHLYTQHQCRLQMGGTDQWGNMTTGTELIRRKAQGEAYAFTTPLITKADGSKFGKVFDHILNSYTNMYETFYGERMTHQHDALAMAEAIWPNLMELEPAHIDVECTGDLTTGMTVTDTRLRNGVQPNGFVAWRIDGDDFHAKLMSRLGTLAKALG